MRLVKNKRINWLSLAGVILSLVGSFIMIMDSFVLFQGFANTFGGFGKVEAGWRELKRFAEKSKDNQSISVLDSNEDGFEEILKIIIGNRSEYSNQRVRAIVNSTHMSYSLGTSKVYFNVISLVSPDRDVPDVIAAEEVVREWISRARLNWVLFCGFSFLFIGFTLSLTAHFCQLKFRKRRLTPVATTLTSVEKEGKPAET